jgi:hypothetical protein
MSKERLQGDVGIEVIASMAKDHLLKTGGHPPTVLVIGTRGTVEGHLEVDMANHQEKVNAMRILGKVLSKERKLGDLRKVFFISEAWISVPGKPGSNPMRPSLDPNRVEILLVSELDMASKKSSILLYEMVRDQGGELREVIPYQFEDDKKGETRSYLLEAFVSGYNESLSERNGKHLH